MTIAVWHFFVFIKLFFIQTVSHRHLTHQSAQGENLALTAESLIRLCNVWVLLHMAEHDAPQSRSIATSTSKFQFLTHLRETAWGPAWMVTRCQTLDLVMLHWGGSRVCFPAQTYEHQLSTGRSESHKSPRAKESNRVNLRDCSTIAKLEKTIHITKKKPQQ